MENHTFSSLQQTPSFPYETDRMTIWKSQHGHLSSGIGMGIGCKYNYSLLHSLNRL